MARQYNSHERKKLKMLFEMSDIVHLNLMSLTLLLKGSDVPPREVGFLLVNRCNYDQVPFCRCQ